MPEACPSMRSTAKCVLPVFVGPRTAMSREASPRAGERFMTINVEHADAPRKPVRTFSCADLLIPSVTFPSHGPGRLRSCPCAPEAPTLSELSPHQTGGRLMFHGQVEGTDL